MASSKDTHLAVDTAAATALDAVRRSAWRTRALTTVMSFGT